MRAKDEVAVFVPSLTVMVIGATPVWPGSGVRLTVRLLSLPLKTMFASGKRAVLEEEPDKVRMDAGLSASPMVNGILGTEEFIREFVAGKLEITGAVLAGSTLTANEMLLDLPPLSMTQTVTVDEPGWPAAMT